jgi:hypothetical protein
MTGGRLLARVLAGELPGLDYPGLRNMPPSPIDGLQNRQESVS